ncbi:GvpL/GvpF family gas vesicle protein [Streptomyces sp. SP18CS02]|uniref:GvpL/GvpF family gas vesicle protein n=1 Tax=Streptomyces sp. SP18CS02 TaxID=3002531 RepID=UPI002E77546B|nr:GvpL/GvpF family gas vesicle protein [Streptomyces sp. SP18CS02]MEE1753932.1 GvpL/GvpF family gas vesicle protein [Streptomyces sp. SP18CS02]
MTERLRYVYAVTRPFEGVLPDGVRGIGDEPPRLLHHGDLTAVVGAVPAEDFDEAPLRAHLEDLDWLAATARAHDAVIAALSTVACPVPLRLATVCRDDSGVRLLLEQGHDRFVRTLDRLDGRVEWGVKVYADPGKDTGGTAPEREPAPGTAPAEGPGAGRTGGGRDYLRRRLHARRNREGDLERADALSRSLHEELSRYAEAGAVHRPQDARLSKAEGVNVLNAAYLVDRARSEAFVERVGRTSEPGIRVELTGPWAPYSFAGIAEEDTGEDGR